MRKIIGIFLIGLVISVFILSRLYHRSKEDNRRLRANQEVLFSEAVFYRTKDSLSVADVERLTLTNREFLRYCGELKQKIQNLNIRIKDLQSVSRTATVSNHPVTVIVKDSILAGKRDTLRCIDFHDAYLTFTGCIEKQEFRGVIGTRDTLIQTVYRVPHKFLFFRWGTKAIRQKIISCNPYSQIVCDDYIEFHRK